VENTAEGFWTQKEIMNSKFNFINPSNHTAVYHTELFHALFGCKFTIWFYSRSVDLYKLINSKMTKFGQMNFKSVYI